MDRHALATRNSEAYRSIAGAVSVLAKDHEIDAETEGLANSLNNVMHRDPEIDSMLRAEAIAKVLFSLANAPLKASKVSASAKQLQAAQDEIKALRAKLEASQPVGKGKHLPTEAPGKPDVDTDATSGDTQPSSTETPSPEAPVASQNVE